MLNDIVKSLGHPEEILNLLKFKMGGCRAVMAKLDYVSTYLCDRFSMYSLCFINRPIHPSYRLT